MIDLVFSSKFKAIFKPFY